MLFRSSDVVYAHCHYTFAQVDGSQPAAGLEVDASSTVSGFDCPSLRIASVFSPNGALHWCWKEGHGRKDGGL